MALWFGYFIVVLLLFYCYFIAVFYLLGVAVDDGQLRVHLFALSLRLVPARPGQGEVITFAIKIFPFPGAGTAGKHCEKDRGTLHGHCRDIARTTGFPVPNCGGHDGTQNGMGARHHPSATTQRMNILGTI